MGVIKERISVACDSMEEYKVNIAMMTCACACACVWFEFFGFILVSETMIYGRENMTMRSEIKLRTSVS